MIRVARGRRGDRRPAGSRRGGPVVWWLYRPDRVRARGSQAARPRRGDGTFARRVGGGDVRQHWIQARGTVSITTINAYAVKRRGGTAEPFSYVRTLGNNEVLVTVTHCSIARGDIQFIDNDWGDTRFPLVPGHEIVGLVAETGSTVTGLTTGDRVGIGYQQEACFSCELCKDGNEQLCPRQKVIGVDCYGGWQIAYVSTVVLHSNFRQHWIRQKRLRCCRRALPCTRRLSGQNSRTAQK